MALVFKGCKFVIKSFEPLVIERDVDIVVDGSTVSCIGRCNSSGGYEVLQCSDLIAIPGLASLYTYVSEVEERRLAALMRKLVACGFTLVGVVSPNPAVAASAVLSAGLRPFVGFRIRAERDVEAAFNICKSLGYACEPLLLAGIEALSEGVAEVLVEALKRSGCALKVYIELINKLKSVFHFVRARGEWPLKFLARLGLLGPSTVLVAPNWIASWEVESLAGSGASVVLTPYSDLVSGVYGLPPLRELVEKRVRVAMGVGNVMLRPNALSLAYDIITLVALHRVRHWDPWPTISLALHMATRVGYEVLGLDGGVIAVGKKADFTLYKVSKLEAFADNTFSYEAGGLIHAVLGSVAAPASYTVVDGRLVWAEDIEGGG